MKGQMWWTPPQKPTSVLRKTSRETEAPLAITKHMSEHDERVANATVELKVAIEFDAV